MNALDKIKLNFRYSQFKNMNIREDILATLLTSKDFKRAYKKNKEQIDHFINHFKVNDYGTDITSSHIENIINLSTTRNHDQYIQIINDTNFFARKIENSGIFNDNKIQKLIERRGIEEVVYNEKIHTVIENNHSDRMLEFFDKYEGNYVMHSQLNPQMFADDIWDVVKTNDKIGDTTLLELMKRPSQLEKITEIIASGNYEGFKYIYENIPDSHHFIDQHFDYEHVDTRMFANDFIERLGTETVQKIFQTSNFSKVEEYEKIFQIMDVGNECLIKDHVHFTNRSMDTRFAGFKVDEIDKDIMETQSYKGIKKDLFLNKYFGLQHDELKYIKLFLESINQIDLPKEFQEKYGEIHHVLNQIISTENEDSLLQLRQYFDSTKREDYQKIIKEFEIEGNKHLKKGFVSEIKEKDDEVKRNVAMIPTTLRNSKQEETNVDVYEFTGEPFTMLVHAISDNKRSENNSKVQSLIDNPANWNNIDEGNNHISKSLISNKFLYTYGNQKVAKEKMVIYGFSELPSESMKFTKTDDAGINRGASVDFEANMRQMLSIPDTNTITTASNLLRETIEKNKGKPPHNISWNEILSLRVDENGKHLMPNYIVCMDEIYSTSVDAAKHFGIPIYLIDTKKYDHFKGIDDQKMKKTSNKKDMDEMLSISIDGNEQARERSIQL